MTKNGRPLVRESAIEHLGDVRVVHHGQGLPLGLEACEHGLRVHARLDQLERDLPLHRLGLLRDPDLAHAAFADPFEQLVAAVDDGRGLGGGPVVGGPGVDGAGPRLVKGGGNRTVWTRLDSSQSDIESPAQFRVGAAQRCRGTPGDRPDRYVPGPRERGLLRSRRAPQGASCWSVSRFLY